MCSTAWANAVDGATRAAPTSAAREILNARIIEGSGKVLI
jgi:hypothetical protein